MKNLFYITIASLFLVSCMDEGALPLRDSIEGYKPIYISHDAAKIVVNRAVRPLVSPGKIYAYKQFIFVNEQMEGVHVIDNADPENPINIAFISIPGNSDISIKDEILYANNVNDLITINIDNLLDVKVINRVPNVFPSATLSYPSKARNNEYFECPDISKGVVIGWELTTLEKPKCQRI